MIQSIVLYLLFFILIVIPTYMHRDSVEDKVRKLHENKKAVKYILLTIPTFFIFFYLSLILSQIFPILQSGWLGMNIAFLPIRDLTPSQVYLSQNLAFYVVLVLFIEIIMTAIVVFNYLEEQYYRDSYRQVGLWAILHLVMGIPLFAVIPIFSMGVIFKKIKDKHGLDQAYAAHVFTNLTFLSILSLYSLLAFL